MLRNMSGGFSAVTVNKDKMRLARPDHRRRPTYVVVQATAPQRELLIDCHIESGRTGGSRLATAVPRCCFSNASSDTARAFVREKREQSACATRSCWRTRCCKAHEPGLQGGCATAAGYSEAARGTASFTQTDAKLSLYSCRVAWFFDAPAVLHVVGER